MHEAYFVACFDPSADFFSYQLNAAVLQKISSGGGIFVESSCITEYRPHFAANTQRTTLTYDGNDKTTSWGKPEHNVELLLRRIKYLKIVALKSSKLCFFQDSLYM